MGRITGSFEFTAPAEVVFGVLTDPDRTTRWLPAGMVAESSDAEKVQIRTGSGTQTYEVRTEPESLRLTWRSVGDDGLHGAAEVEDGAAGGSVVRAEVEVREQLAGDQRADELLAEAMRHLQRDVSDNFNAG